jgi:mono/diheme cytochrome c family protein
MDRVMAGPLLRRSGNRLLARAALNALLFGCLGQGQTLVNQYCVGCHNDTLKSGGFSWTTLDAAHPERNVDEAEKVIRKVRAGLMPPPGLPRPSVAVMKGFARQLEDAVDRAAALHPNPGRPALHRLNRAEYANVVRDLLGVDTDVTSLLPTDDMSHGFDNMADVLTISPALMQGYIRAAGKISREAVGDPAALALTDTYSIPRTAAQTRHVPGTPFGTRGGMSKIHNFPADGEYAFKIGLYYAATGALFGMNQGKGQQIEI